MRNLGCIACHSLDGTARQGPTLLGRFGSTIQAVSDGKTKTVVVDEAYLLRALEAPNADIAVGFNASTMPRFVLSDSDKTALIAALVELGDTAKLEERKGEALSLWWLVLSVIAFVGGHLLMSSVHIRTALIGSIGDKAFQGVYSLVAIVSMGVMAWAWTEAPYIPLWDPPLWTHWVPFVTMPFILVMFIAGYTTESPTIAGMEGTLKNPEAAQGILKVTRHPANLSMAAWGLVHMVPNPDVAALLLFGAITTLGLIGTWHIEARRKAQYGEDWERFTANTSVVPFAAIASGRASVTLAEIGWWRIALGLGAYVSMIFTHIYMIGASPLPW